MSHSTPLRGRSFTPPVTGVSARKSPARSPELPTEKSTVPDELTPADADVVADDEALRSLHDESVRYLQFARKLSEEVVLQTSDERLEPTG